MTGRTPRGRPPQRLEPAIIAGRVPPHDLDAEAAVLSAILLSREALDRVLEILKPEHFYSDANGRIYEAAQELASTIPPTPVDVVSVASFLRDRERLRQIGGPTYLGQLSDATPAVAHVTTHAQFVYEKWRLRALIATCQRVAAEGYGDVGVVQEFIDDAEQSIYDLAHVAGRQDMTTIGAELREEFTVLTEAHERGDALVGYPTGYEKLDERLAGLSPGDLTLIAGRPGMGKTAAGTGIAVHMAAPRKANAPRIDGSPGYMVVDNAPGYGVCIFSLEMPKAQLRGRMLCSEARVDFNKYRKRRLQAEDWRLLTDAGSFMASLPIWIDDTSAISLLEIRAKVRRKQAEYNRPAAPGVPERKVGLVLIDYLQLMSAPDHIENREQQIGYLSRGLKSMSKELGVPVIALAQLNRGVETRSTKDKRPQISDLRESGSLEQDADNIILLYRDEYYYPDTTKAKGLAEWHAAKVRNGPTGKMFLVFSGNCTRFDNLAAGDYPEIDEG